MNARASLNRLRGGSPSGNFLTFVTVRLLGGDLEVRFLRARSLHAAAIWKFRVAFTQTDCIGKKDCYVCRDMVLLSV